MARRRRRTPEYQNVPPVDQLWDLFTTLSCLPTEIKSLKSLDASHIVIPLGNCRWRIDKDPAQAIARNIYDTHTLLWRIKMLKPAFPSSPQRPPILELKFIREGHLVASLNFAEYYAAYAMLQEFIHRHDYMWQSDDVITTDEEITIASNAHELDRLITRKYTKEELEWELPSNYKRLVAQIKGLTFVPTQTTEPIERDTPEPSPSKRKSREDRSQPTKRTPKDSSLVQLADIASAINLDAKEARNILRKHATKPDHGAWAWPSDEVEAIKTLLTKNRKK